MRKFLILTISSLSIQFSTTQARAESCPRFLQTIGVVIGIGGATALLGVHSDIRTEPAQAVYKLEGLHPQNHRDSVLKLSRLKSATRQETLQAAALAGFMNSDLVHQKLNNSKIDAVYLVKSPNTTSVTLTEIDRKPFVVLFINFQTNRDQWDADLDRAIREAKVQVDSFNFVSPQKIQD